MTIKTSASLVVVVALTLGTSALAAEPAVLFRGKISKPGPVALSELQKMKQIDVEAEDHGVKASFRGVALSELLAHVGAPAGKELRGDKLALYALVTAADGYRAVFALAELDPAFTDRVIIVAYQRDGKALSKPEGPFRIVVPGEKRAARWVREVTAIEIRDSSP